MAADGTVFCNIGVNVEKRRTNGVLIMEDMSILMVQLAGQEQTDTDSMPVLNFYTQLFRV